MCVGGDPYRAVFNSDSLRIVILIPRQLSAIYVEFEPKLE